MIHKLIFPINPFLSLDCIELSGDEDSGMPEPQQPTANHQQSVLKQQLANSSTPHKTRSSYLQQQLATGPRNPPNHHTNLEYAIGSPHSGPSTRVRMNLLRRAAIQEKYSSNNSTATDGDRNVPSEMLSPGKWKSEEELLSRIAINLTDPSFHQATPTTCHRRQTTVSSHRHPQRLAGRRAPRTT